MSGRRARAHRGEQRGLPSAPPGSLVLGIGLVSHYLTAGDLTNRPQGLEAVVTALAAVPVERALDWTARMLAPSWSGPTWRTQQAEQARLWFDASTTGGRRARDLVLSGERLLLAPQVLLVMARLALAHSSRRPASDDQSAAEVAAGENGLRNAMLVLAHHLGVERQDADTAAAGPDGRVQVGGPDLTAFEAGLAANQMLNRLPYPASVFDRFERRWREIPREQAGGKNAVDLFGEFQAATGVGLADLGMVAVTLWARAVGDDGPRVGPAHLDDLGLGPARTTGAVALLSGTVEELAERSAKADPDADPEFDMTLFGQAPVVRLDGGGLLVLSPVLLLERAFGWLPAIDIREGLSASGDEGRKRAARALTFLRQTTHIQAVETLRHAVEAGRAPGVLYGEEQVQAAFGTSAPNADVACAWPGGAWVVVEVSSRQITRRTAAAASPQDLAGEIEKGLAKARQLDGTVRALRADQSRLTGRSQEEGVQRFWPLLVFTEGFPVNPPTVRRLRRMVREAALLTDDDTAPLVVVDTETLEAVETVAERGGPSLPELLEGHAQSELREYGLREWLLLTHRGLRPPERLMDRWDRALAPAIAALEAERGAAGRG